MICEHRVLTTGQITQLAFGTSRAATAAPLPDDEPPGERGVFRSFGLRGVP